MPQEESAFTPTMVYSNVAMASLFSGNKTMINGGYFTQINQAPPLNHARMLLGQSIAEGARHDSAERYSAPTCHPNTRVAVIENIMCWINSPLDSDQPKIKCLNGAAGAGKSTIMQTVAMSCANEGTLGGSFFFKRSDNQRGDAKHLISTLAYQLCQTIPEIRPYIEAAVDLDPTFLSLSLPTQFTRLILSPLQAIFHQLKKPIVIAIDGLDECDHRPVQEHIINLLLDINRDSRSALIPFRFLIASRRESHIVSAFSLALASSSTPPFTEINLTNNSFNVNDDIRLYMNAKFDVIRTKRDIPLGWPTEGDLERILKLSSGQFIFSSIVNYYVDSDDHHPRVRLQKILQYTPHSTEENPFASLDSLYSHIFSEVPQHHVATLHKILPIFLNPIIRRHWEDLRTPFTRGLPCSCGVSSTLKLWDVRNIERVLGLAEGDIDVSLRHLSAVISLEYSHDSDDKGREARVHHGTLGDFLNAEDRAGRFFLGDFNTQVQNHIGRVLRVALHPFLKDGTEPHSTHDTRFDHTKCECGMDTQQHRTRILLKHICDCSYMYFPPLRHADMRLLNQIDFAKVFDDNSPINQISRFRHISYITGYLWRQMITLEEPVRTALIAFNDAVSQQLLSNYRPTLSHDYQAGDLLQLLLNVRHRFIFSLLQKEILLSDDKTISGDVLFVKNFLYVDPLLHDSFLGYVTLLSKCAQEITAHDPSWARIVSDPRYQLKSVHLSFWAMGQVFRLAQSSWSTRETDDNLFGIFDASYMHVVYKSEYLLFRQAVDTLLPKAAFSPEVILLFRVIVRYNAHIRSMRAGESLSNFGRVPRQTENPDVEIWAVMEDYISRHKYCDETCQKAQHDTPIEQIYRAWKDLKRYGLCCEQTIYSSLKAIEIICKLLTLTTILYKLMRILAVYHIISNPDMIVYDLTRHLIPIMNFIIIARAWFGCWYI